MRLLATEEEFKKLVDCRLISPVKDKLYSVNLGIKGQPALLEVVLEIIPSAQSGVMSSAEYFRDYNKEYKDFLESYPKSDAIGDRFPRSRSLRSDTGNSYPRYKALIIEHRLSPELIKRAMTYEVFNRVSNSITENKLRYMRQSEAWLNDPVGIKDLYEDSLKDQNFLRHLENEESVDPSGYKSFNAFKDI